MNRNIHIITFNVPYPPDYGGVIDTFYRIKTLYEMGIKIHLHCFEYGRPHSNELASICETINYYKRRSGIWEQLSLLPYIVSTRKSKELLANLIRDDYPILFDGLHSTFHLDHPALAGRRKLVRAHNIEHKYYKSLAHYESNLLKKLFYLIESCKLKRYEKRLGKANRILSISGIDQEYFNKRFHNSELIGPSHPFSKVESQPGFGKYILFHGDLSVNENAIIAESLISGVFSKIEYPCVIAGRNPSEKLFSLASNHNNIRIISNPDNLEMMHLIQNAHINILPSLASNGFKIKVLIALFTGRHCLVNDVNAKGNSIECLFIIGNSDEEYILKIKTLMEEPFTEETIAERRKVLSEDFENLNNAKKLVELFFGS